MRCLHNYELQSHHYHQVPLAPILQAFWNLHNWNALLQCSNNPPQYFGPKIRSIQHQVPARLRSNRLLCHCLNVAHWVHNIARIARYGSRSYVHLWLLFSCTRNHELRCFILLWLDDWLVHTALRWFAKLGRWMTNIRRNIFICLLTHLSIVATEFFLHNHDLIFWLFAPIDARCSVNIIIFGRFSQTNLMLRHTAQRLIQVFLINICFLYLLILKVGMFKLETLHHMLKDLWTAGSLVSFLHGSKVPSAVISALRVITKKVHSIGYRRLAVFILFLWPYHICKKSFEKSCLSFAKTKKTQAPKFYFLPSKLKLAHKNWFNSCSSTKTHMGNTKAISASLPKLKDYCVRRYDI